MVRRYCSEIHYDTKAKIFEGLGSKLKLNFVLSLRFTVFLKVGLNFPIFEFEFSKTFTKFSYRYSFNY